MFANSFFKVYKKRFIWSIISLLFMVIILVLYIVTYNNSQEAFHYEEVNGITHGRTLRGLSKFYIAYLYYDVVAFITHLIFTFWMITNIKFGLNSGRVQAKLITINVFLLFCFNFFVLGFVSDNMVYTPTWGLFGVMLVFLLISPIINKEHGPLKYGRYTTLKSALINFKGDFKKSKNI